VLFHSLTFFIFFPTVVALFFATPPRHRWILLLAASYVFYGAWKPQYLILLVLTTAVDYGVGVLLGREQGPARRRALLVASLVANLGVLFTFKYLNFCSASLRGALHRFGLPDDIPSLDVLLPVGVSFYTFQSISYTIDVYRRDLEPEPHFGRFALYVAFFPQLVAGPIERSTRLLPQFRETQRWDFDRAVGGLGWMLWGLFKKVVVADRAATFVDAVYRQPGDFQGLSVVAATYAFAYQIYCDFSGYSDIARGAARVMGFELMQNFDRPYAAATITDFWRRWHISLSTWFRDYLYVPLGGSRAGWSRRAANLAVVFLVSGLWHGASWTFVVWGAYHGALMIAAIGVERLSGRYAAGLRISRPLRVAGRALEIALTFHLVCLGWVLFRADDLGHAWELLLRLPVSYPASVVDELARIGPAPPAATTLELAILVLSIAMVEGVERFLRTPRLARTPVPVRWLAWASLCVWILLTAVQSHSPFIYFQF
jgi:D-alanyl-lipoteichoic acid acyltransferase DltB (MBOAT superfamily)